MAQPVPGDNGHFADVAYSDDDTQRRSDDDAEVVDDDDLAGAPRASQPNSMPLLPRRAAATPQRQRQRKKTAYHHIGSPLSHRSDRTRTERGIPAPKRVLADPPSAMATPVRPTQQGSGEPSLSDILATIQLSSERHSAELSAVMVQQRAQTEAIEDLSHRTEALEASASSARAATESLAERVRALNL